MLIAVPPSGLTRRQASLGNVYQTPWLPAVALPVDERRQDPALLHHASQYVDHRDPDSVSLPRAGDRHPSRSAWSTRSYPTSSRRSPA